MASRFWVTGGTGNWNDTSNWSATSGGASGASVPGSSDTATLNASSGSGTVTLDISPDIQTLTCTGFTGTLAFGTNTISLNSTGTIYTGATTMTVTGTPQIICTNSGSASRTITTGVVTEANSISFRITAGTGSVGFTTNQTAVRNLDFTDGVNPTGFSGAFGNASNTIYGDFKASTGMTRTAGTGLLTFAATSGTKTINTAGVTFDCPFTFNGVGGTWQLQAALTSGATRGLTLTNGTFDLNGYTATFGTFSSTNSNVRTLAFGSTGKIVLMATSGTIFTTGTITNLTVTGTSLVQATNGGAGTRSLTFGTGALSEANAINFEITTGSDIVSLGGTGGAAKNVNFTGFSGTIDIPSTKTIYGNFDAGSATSITGTSTVTFAATSGTKTLRTNGLTYGGGFNFNGVGGTWSLQDALTLSATLTLTNGTLTTNGYALTLVNGFSSNNANVRTLNLGASLVTISGTGTPWNIPDPTNMTLNAGTSSLVFTGTASTTTFQGGSFTYYDITLPTGAANNFQFSGANTFRNVTAINPVSPGRRLIILAGTTTITGTLSCSGSAANSRNRFVTNSVGISVSLVVASVAAISDVDFADITLTGAAAPVSGTRLGNMGGNTGIVFGAGKTVYWNQPAGGLWSDTAWALSSGGAVNANNFPLAQDTVIFDDTGVGSGSTISIQYGWAFDTFNASTLTNALTVDWTSVTGGSTFIFGDVTLSSAVTFTSSGTAPLSFSGRRNGSFVTVTSAGVAWPQSAFQINCVSPDTVKLGDNLVSTGTQVALPSGVIDLNGKTLSCVTFDGSNANNSVRSIAFNGGLIDVTGNSATVWACEDLTNFSYTGTPTVNFTYSGSVGQRFFSNGVTAGATEANMVNFNITAGSDIFGPTTGGNYTGNLTYAPAFTGEAGVPYSLTTSGTTGGIYGNLTLSPGCTASVGNLPLVFLGVIGTKTITTNGVTIDRPLVFNGVGGSWALQDALTLGTKSLQLLAGTLTTNGYAISVGKFGGSTAYGDRTLNLGSSLFTCLGAESATASWQVEDGGFLYTVNAGTSTIFMSEPFTGTSTQNFIGSGKTYYNVVYTTTQPGGFVFGNNTFNTISNTAQPLTLSFEAGSVQTVNNFNVSGTAGNLVTLNSVTPGTQWSLAKRTGGKVLVSYVSITDSAATPAGYWFAPTSQGNVDGGNNTGWNFGTVGGAGGFLPFF
jgi:hypothetical protein